MKENICKPLGMTDTTFHPETRPDPTRPNVTHDWDMQSDARWSPWERCSPGPDARPERHWRWCYSVCHNIQTACDLPNFVKLSTAILQDGGTILKERSVDEIFKPRLDRNAKEALAALRSVYTG
ncbi:hypothetical protein FRB93_010531 [Tulasnella sp. JGI-2019a]|nr:hypothetical protein FRB93_010531 [Tulasnella sp. JGI-2019a]